MPFIKTNKDVDLFQEVRAAVTTASMGETGKTRRVLLKESDLPTLVPSQSLLKVRSIKFKELRKGDVLLVRIGTEFRVRRYVKSKMTRDDTLLFVVSEGSAEKESMPLNSLLGKVAKVEVGGRVFDPGKTESFLQALQGKLTDFGTRKFLGVFAGP